MRLVCVCLGAAKQGVCLDEISNDDDGDDNATVEVVCVAEARD